MEKEAILTVNQAIEAAANPEGWFDFNGGVNIDDNTIAKWIKDGLKDAIKCARKNGKDSEFFSISSGNTKVFGEIYKQEDGKHAIHISVCKNYKEKTLFDVDITQ